MEKEHRFNLYIEQFRITAPMAMEDEEAEMIMGDLRGTMEGAKKWIRSQLGEWEKRGVRLE